MSELIIIGNGFDLHHDLKTSYGSFVQFAKENSPSVYDLLTGLFVASRDYLGFDLPEDLSENDSIYSCWCDFETSIGMLDDEEFGQLSRENVSEYLQELGMEETIVDEFIENVASILDTFREWAVNIDLNQGRKGGFKFNSSTFFVNFNYTETLEKFYGVKPENIKYIHGSRLRSAQLIVDHSSNPPKSQSKHDLPDIQYNPYYSYLRKTKKPVDAILPEFSKWLDSLPDIKTISIRGHSLGHVDLPYFRVISLNFLMQNGVLVISVKAVSKIYNNLSVPLT